MRRFPLQTYLFLGLGVLAAVPALLLGGVQTQQWGAQQVAQAERESQLAAELLARETGQLMAMHVREVESLARQVEARESLEPTKLQTMLTAQRASSDGLSLMYIGDRRGIAIAVDPPLNAVGQVAAGTDYSDRDYYREVMRTGRTAVSRAQLGKNTQRPNIQVAAPIWWDGQTSPIGFAEGTVELADIQMLAKRIAVSHPGLKMVVLDAEGRVLAHPDEGLRANMASLAGVPLFQPATGAGEIRVADDETGTAYRAAVEPITEHGLGWLVVVGRPEAEVQAFTHAAQEQTVGVAAAAVALSLLLAGLLAALVARPIAALSQVADNVARGDLTRPLPRPRWWYPREVHTQLLAVGHMIQRLGARTQELEQQVAARTVELVTANRELQAAQQRYQSLFAHNPDAVFALDRQGRVQSINPAHEALSGYPADVLLGRRFRDVFDTGASESQTLQRLERVLCGQPHSYETTITHRDGHPVTLYVTLLPIVVDGQIVGAYGIAKDISERKTLEAELAHRAYYDALTDLPNRALLVARLGHALARGTRGQQRAAVLFIDLDDFKIVNDSLGHAVGDQLLVATAQRLRASVRPGDTVARLGGDEFIVLLEDLATADDASAAAERILAQLEAPFSLAEREVFVGASIGVALSGSEPLLPDDLLRQADAAMYVAKARGKGHYELFEPGMHAQPLERLTLEADLRRALERDELQLHYQPIVELATGQIRGVEALLRWQHPERGLVAPGAFVPLAEETGLIVPIGRWVLQAACRQARAWRDRHPSRPPLVMSVNISGRQFQHPGLVEDVAQALQASGLPAGDLRLEITESVAMEAGLATVQTLQALKGLGVQLAIDDFGTGYSSLAYLKRFPVDILKIDRSFVDGLGQDPQDTAIVRSVITIAKTLNLAVTGEGIETLEQLQELRTLGCDEGQGYYFARPATADALSRLIDAGRLGPDANGLVQAA